MSSLVKRFESTLWIPRPVNEVFAFFSDAYNLEKITPPWLKFKVLSQSTPKIEEGTHFSYSLRIKGIPMSWESKITKSEENEQFMDSQLVGPYKKWEHLHEFLEKDGGTLMKDTVDYELPLGWAGRILAGWMVDRDVRNIFSYRSNIIKQTFS